jgi:hypothetical protein
MTPQLRARAGDKLSARCCIPVGSLTRSGPPDRRVQRLSVGSVGPIDLRWPKAVCRYH